MYFIIIIIIIITLFQEDNIFGTDVSLTYGPQLTNVDMLLKKCTDIQLFTVCTELMLSVHRADCERATQPYSSGGGSTIFPGSRPANGYHTFVLVIECFLTCSMLFLKCIYIFLQSPFSHAHIRYER